VTDEANFCVSSGHSEAWESLATHYYALTTDRSLGLPEKFRQNFRDAYFNSWTLHHDEGDWPADRQRARDVIRYRWSEGNLQLSRHDAITIVDRAEIPGKREHSRVELTEDPQALELIRAFLQLLPPNRRQADGTFGVNLFRTFTNVVTKPHQDDEEFIIIYVLDRVGDGAETHLYRAGDVTEDGEVTGAPVLKHQLNPGDIIIFEDCHFKHDASPLISPPDELARRDVLVCTVDYRETYLAAAAEA
jgi:2-oxoglutarate-Fe(II)-dependent dioxygenase family protein